LTYATHVYNTTPKDVFCPADIFFGSGVLIHRLMDLHIWGCPLYVLDPKIQQGQKLPRWEPRSKRGMLMGLSQQHASEVPLVLNLGTGSITTQFYVVFGDLFTNVPSIERENEAPEHCAELCLENSTHLMLDSPPEHLNDEWFTAEELEIKRRRQKRDERPQRKDMEHLLFYILYELQGKQKYPPTHQHQMIRQKIHQAEAVILSSPTGLLQHQKQREKFLEQRE
jgi:hypothetical protein